jgi:hypothetical protein
MPHKEYQDFRGYVRVWCPDHPKADKNGVVLKHILIAEDALGKYLPDGAVIHHASKEALVICQDQAYHQLIHVRTRALVACGNPNWRKCPICKKYDNPDQMAPLTRGFWHRSCLRSYRLLKKGVQHGADPPQGT